MRELWYRIVAWSPFWRGWDGREDRCYYRWHCLGPREYFRLVRDRFRFKATPIPPKPNKVLVIDIERNELPPGSSVDWSQVQK